MMTHEQTLEALATYALDAVDGAERADIEQHLTDCPRCRAELDTLRQVATALGNSVEPVPPGLWAGIASRLSERPGEDRPPMPRLVDVPAEGEVAPAVTPIRRYRATVAGLLAVAAAIAFLGGVLVRGNNDSPAPTGQADASAVVSALLVRGHKVVDMDGAHHTELAKFVVDPDGRGFLISSTLPKLTESKTYQLWGVVHGQPISLGLLGQKPDMSTFTLAGTASASQLGITVEPAGGAVVPSSPMVAEGAV